MLYYHDTKLSDSGNTFVTTVKENEEYYTNRQIDAAKKAWFLQRIMDMYLKIIDKKLIPNYPVQRNDIVAVEKSVVLSFLP